MLSGSGVASATSPARRLAESVAAILDQTHPGAPLERAAGRLLGFGDIPPAPAVPPLPGTDAAVVDAAFGYRLRYDLGPYRCADAGAVHGANVVVRADRSVADRLGAFFAETDRLAARWAPHRGDLTADDDLELVRRCVVLARVEAAWATGVTGHLLPLPADVRQLAPPAEVDDVAALHRSAAKAFAPLLDRVAAGVRYVARPAVAGGLAAGAAPADLLIGDELLAVEVSATLDPAALREVLVQLLATSLLDYDDDWGVRRVGAYFARHRFVPSWPLWVLVFPPHDVLGRFASRRPPAPSEVDSRLREVRAAMRLAVQGRPGGAGEGPAEAPRASRRGVG
ncbi:MAG TPA: hypothetical protein VKU91_05575 [Acidimicrobiales bacterium]|nr:hypothetical protein [Acidimicrobiales bacterium]